MILRVLSRKKIFISTLFFVVIMQLLQGQELSGIVTYGDNYTPVSNITVRTRVNLGNNQKSTVTDINGKYLLKIDSLDASVMFFSDSSLYRFEEFDIAGKTKINVMLKKTFNLCTINIDCYAIHKMSNVTDPSFEITKIEKSINTTLVQSSSLSTLLCYLSDSLNYPYLAAKEGIQGRIWVTFEIDNNNFVANINILRKVDSLLDEVVKKVIEEIPIDISKNIRNEYNNEQFEFVLCLDFRLK